MYNSREELLEFVLPHNAICAEIGVWRGAFSKKIWDISKPKKLHLIDLWGDTPDLPAHLDVGEKTHFDNMNCVSRLFMKEIKAGNVILHQGMSVAVSQIFPANYFDWVYFDADHQYKSVLADHRNWSKVTKPTGFLSGHDYVIEKKDRIVQAVLEFCAESDWKILYITKPQPNDKECNDVSSYILGKN